MSGNLECGFRIEEDGGWPNIDVAQQVREYDPQNEVIILVQRPSGDEYCLRVRTPEGSLPPLAACEEFYRNAHRPLDVFESLMNDPLSEQDQQRTNEHEPSVKRDLQDFLRALRFNLEAVQTTGLELDELCPYVIYGHSCVKSVVLLSALRDGILRIDDSDGRRLWKRGPKWTKLEKILLSQDETDTTPS